jgi:hypothetical protein
VIRPPFGVVWVICGPLDDTLLAHPAVYRTREDCEWVIRQEFPTGYNLYTPVALVYCPPLRVKEMSAAQES